MVTNVELVKKVEEKKKALNEKTRLLDEALEEMREKLKEVEEATLAKKDVETSTCKGKKEIHRLGRCNT